MGEQPSTPSKSPARAADRRRFVTPRGKSHELADESHSHQSSARPPPGARWRVARAKAGERSAALHAQNARLVFVQEDTTEFARRSPAQEWMNEAAPDQIAHMLGGSALAVREAVNG